jgi:hypothetical protein
MCLLNLCLFSRVQMPKKRPEYRADRDHDAFLTRLKSHLPSVDDFEARVVRQLTQKFDVVATPAAALPPILAALMEPHERDAVVRTKVESIEEYLRKESS